MGISDNSAYLDCYLWNKILSAISKVPFVYTFPAQKIFAWDEK